MNANHVNVHTEAQCWSNDQTLHVATAVINAWQNRVAQLNKNIGVVDQFAVHHFHGSKKNRGYDSRDKILVQYQFDPIADLRRNHQGILELTGNKPGLRDAIRRYFISRNEDDPTQ